MVVVVGTDEEIASFLNNDLIKCPKDAQVIEECPIGNCLTCVAESLGVKLLYTER